MNKALFVGLILLVNTCMYTIAQSFPVINEVMTANITVLPDEYDIIPYNCPVNNCTQWYADLGESIYDGNYPGWVELYNPGAITINLSGLDVVI